MQTFQPSRAGLLTSLNMTLFQSGGVNCAGTANPVDCSGPNQDLIVSLVELDDRNQPTTTISTGTISRAFLSYSPSVVRVPVTAELLADRSYGIKLTSSATGDGCYGYEYAEQNPYARGGEFKQQPPGSGAFVAEPDLDLKFFSVMEPAKSSAPLGSE